MDILDNEVFYNPLSNTWNIDPKDGRQIIRPTQSLYQRLQN